MWDTPNRARMRARLSLRVFAAAIAATACLAGWSDSRAQPQPTGIAFHAVSSGGAALTNSCFRLSGTIGQAAPGYSSTTPLTYSVYAGFWAEAPTTGLDEVFFNGFESC